MENLKEDYTLPERLFFGARAPLQMTMQEFQALATFISERTGLQFPPEKKYFLENRVGQRAAELGCRSYEEYLNFAENDPSQSELARLTSAVTINETSFMRNLPQLKAFQEIILPELVARLQRGQQRKVRIWSAGCSSGDEPYSIAILAAEKLSQAPWLRQIEIIATDVDLEILEKARIGVYRPVSLRNTPPALQAKYFTRQPDGFVIASKIRSMVRFAHLNLVDSARVRLLENFDVIFFRNVMIYFGAGLRKRIVSQMYDMLNPGGYLILGHSESLQGISKAFKSVNLGNSLMYRKE